MSLKGSPELFFKIFKSLLLPIKSLLLPKLRLLFPQNEVIVIVIGVKFWEAGGGNFSINIIRDDLLLLLDVVGGLSVGSFPVLLIQMGMVHFVVGDTTRSRVTILKLSRGLIVTVALQVNPVLEGLVPV